MSTKHLSGKLNTLFCIGIFLFSSCEYEFIEPEPVVIPEVISFADDILTVFANKCSLSGCHTTGNPIVDLTAANAYTQLFGKQLIDLDIPESSSLYLKLTAPGSTHQGRSTPQEQALILEWIRKGARNN